MYVIRRKSDGKLANFHLVATSDGYIDAHIGFITGDCLAVFDREDIANKAISKTRPRIATFELPAWQADYREAVITDNVEVIKIALDLL